MESAFSNWVPGPILVSIIALLAMALLFIVKGFLSSLISKLDVFEKQLIEINLKFSNMVSVEEHTKSVTKIWEEINKIRERIVIVEAHSDFYINSPQ